LFEVLPSFIKSSLKNVDFQKVNEVRLRANRPVMVEYGGSKTYLTSKGISLSKSDAVFITKEHIEEVFFSLCNKSVYAYTDKINRGFITDKNGLRVGVCGECVVENGKIINIKNLTSLNFRIPHAVKGCSKKVIEFMKNEVKSTLIISHAGVGKTTIARDLVSEISDKFLLNVLVVDERNEIFPLLSCSDTVDCITYSPKRYAFENGIRAMSPEVIVTDEIYGEEDIRCIERASLCGVKVIATMHGDEYGNFYNDIFEPLKRYFELFVFLDESVGKGTVGKIINCKGEIIYSL